MGSIRLLFATLASLTAAAVAVVGAQSSPQGDDAFRFKSGVELVNVTATVSDDNGHFVTGLTKDDFTIYEDGQPQDISQFSNERVPVSLGILLDTSGSMTPEKMSSARNAIDRFIYDLLGKDDELFFMQFASVPDLVQGWTFDRRATCTRGFSRRPASSETHALERSDRRDRRIICGLSANSAYSAVKKLYSPDIFISNFHWASFTGITDSRGSRTNAKSANSFRAFTSASVGCFFNRRKALISTTESFSFFCFGSGYASRIISASPINAFSSPVW